MEDTQHRSVADTLFAGAAAAGAGGRKNKWHAIHVPGAPAIEPNLEDGKPARGGKTSPRWSTEEEQARGK